MKTSSTTDEEEPLDPDAVAVFNAIVGPATAGRRSVAVMRLIEAVKRERAESAIALRRARKYLFRCDDCGKLFSGPGSYFERPDEPWRHCQGCRGRMGIR